MVVAGVVVEDIVIALLMVDVAEWGKKLPKQRAGRLMRVVVVIVVFDVV